MVVMAASTKGQFEYKKPDTLVNNFCYINWSFFRVFRGLRSTSHFPLVGLDFVLKLHMTGSASRVYSWSAAFF